MNYNAGFMGKLAERINADPEAAVEDLNFKPASLTDLEREALNSQIGYLSQENEVLKKEANFWRFIAITIALLNIIEMVIKLFVK